MMNSKKERELTEEERLILLEESRAKYLSDQRTMLEGATAKGREEGEHNTRLVAIKEMLVMEMSLTNIARVFKMTLEELNQFIEENNLIEKK